MHLYYFVLRIQEKQHLTMPPFQSAIITTLMTPSWLNLILQCHGSEFKNPSYLQEILQDHPHWDLFHKILLKGATFPLNPISNYLRLQDLLFHKERGNNKSVETNSNALASIIENDVIKGYALPLPAEILFKIPNTSLDPVGCICQHSINKQGLKTSKLE